MNTFQARIQAQRGYVMHPRPWPEIVRDYSDAVAHGLPLAPMLCLVEAVAASSSAAELFAVTSMHDLLLSDHADFRSSDSVLVIRYLPTRQEFSFEHRPFSGPSDQKMCPAAEGIATLSLFLRYKFGILLSGAVA